MQKPKKDENQLTIEDVYVREGYKYDYIYNMMTLIDKKTPPAIIKYALKTILRDYLNFEGLKYDDIYYKIKDKEFKEFTSRKRFQRYKQALINYFGSFSNYGKWLDRYFNSDINDYIDRREYKGNTEKERKTRKEKIREMMMISQKNRWLGKFDKMFPLHLLVALQINFIYGLNTLFDMNNRGCYAHFIRGIKAGNTERSLIEKKFFIKATDTILFETRKGGIINSGDPYSFERFIILLEKVTENLKSLFKYIFIEYGITRAYTNYTHLLEENKLLLLALEDKRQLAGQIIKVAEAFDKQYKTTIVKDIIEHGCKMGDLTKENGFELKVYTGPEHRLLGKPDCKYTDFYYRTIEQDRGNNYGKDAYFTQYNTEGKEIKTIITSAQMMRTEELHNKYISSIISRLGIELKNAHVRHPEQERKKMEEEIPRDVLEDILKEMTINELENASENDFDATDTETDDFEIKEEVSEDYSSEEVEKYINDILDQQETNSK